MRNIVIVGGSKGGVGKSMVSFTLVDWYLRQGRKVRLVETDDTNADVGEAYEDALGDDFFGIDLDQVDGWLDLMDVIHTADCDVVVNSAARSNAAIKKNGVLLNKHIEDGLLSDRPLLTIWPINCDVDSVDLLNDYLQVMTKGRVYVFRNLFFNVAEKFRLYNESQVKKIVEEKGKTYNFPSLAFRVANELRSTRITLADALEKMSFGNQIELDRWRDECAKIYDDMIGGN